MKFVSSLLLVLSTFLVIPAFAQTDFGLKAEFYNSKDLSGAVVRTRIDKIIDFDFGYQAPITGMNIDNYSVRWTGLVAPPVTTTYTFSTYSDDGVRLWVNGVKVIDNWTDHAPVYDDSTAITLVAGQKYDIKLEYFEGILGAQIQLYWAYPGQARQVIPATQLFHTLSQFPPTPVAGNGTGLRADYYPNLDLAGDPVVTRTEASVNNDWGSNAPAVGVGADQFTARWRGQVQAPISGEIIFSTVSDDGVRLWIDGQLVISNWGPHGVTTNYADPLTLVAGQKYDIRMEYLEFWGSAVAKLNWSYYGQSEQAIPQKYLSPATSVFTYATQPWLDLTPENKDAARFLQQATFGATVQDILDVRAKGYDAWLTEQFNLPQASHQDFLNAIRDTGQQRIYVDKTLESFWTQALSGRDQLRQRVAFALSEILVVSQLGGGLDDQPWATASYLDMLGKNSFGNFRQLLEDVTLHPAMGKYLDMLNNDKEDPVSGRTPNENYAREILQLFSIGLYQLNPDGMLKLDANGKAIQTYDQEEIKGFARVFSGWHWGNNPVRTDANWYFPPNQYNWDKPMQAWPTHHSTGEKLVLNGVKIPSGQTPEKDLQDALDNIFSHPNIGPFIGRQLIQRLVTSNPSPAYITRVTAAFNNNGAGVRGDMKAVIKAILLDEEARSISRSRYGVSRQGSRRTGNAQQSNQNVLSNPTNFGKLREPILRLTALMRAFNAQTTGNRYRISYTDSTDYGLGQSPLRAPSVFNFYEPDYAYPGTITKANIVAPEFKSANETTVIGTANYFRDVIYWGHYFWTLNPVTLDYSTQVAWASDPAKMVDQLNLLLMNGTMTDAMRTSIISAVNDLTARQPGERLRAAIYLIVASKEFVVQK